MHDASGRRPMRLADGMLLVAVTAVGLAMVRYRLTADSFRMTGLARISELHAASTWIPAPKQSRTFAGCVAAILFAWSFALFVLDWRIPRERLRDRLRQPGILALAVAALFSLLHLGGLLARAAIEGWPRRVLMYLVDESVPTVVYHDHFPSRAFDTLAGRVGWLIGLAWLMLWLRGGWRRPVDWVDRAGRVVGVLWMVAQALAFFP